MNFYTLRSRRGKYSILNEENTPIEVRTKERMYSATDLTLLQLATAMSELYENLPEQSDCNPDKPLNRRGIHFSIEGRDERVSALVVLCNQMNELLSRIDFANQASAIQRRHLTEIHKLSS